MKMTPDKAKQVLESKGMVAAWDIYQTQDQSGFKYEETTIHDMVGKLIRWGSLSDRASDFMAALLKRIPERTAKEALQAAEAAAAAPVPVTDARMLVEGEVLTIKMPTGMERFPSVKMLLKTDAGFKLWGTQPSALSGAGKGDRVAFEAKVTPSNDDPKFGFWSRPTKARIVTAVATAA